MMSASTARSRRQVGHGRVDDASSAPASTVERLRAGGDRDPRPGDGRRRLDPDPGEQVALLVGSERRAQEPVDAGRPERDVGRRGLDRVGVDGAGGDLAAGPLGDQASRPVGAEPGQPRLLALLEAQARLRPERIAEGRPADADRVEDGRLDDDVRRRVADLGARRRP